MDVMTWLAYPKRERESSAAVVVPKSANRW
jgi:hypothetical protein